MWVKSHNFSSCMALYSSFMPFRRKTFCLILGFVQMFLVLESVVLLFFPNICSSTARSPCTHLPSTDSYPRTAAVISKLALPPGVGIGQKTVSEAEFCTRYCLLNTEMIHFNPCELKDVIQNSCFMILNWFFSSTVQVKLSYKAKPASVSSERLCRKTLQKD